MDTTDPKAGRRTLSDEERRARARESKRKWAKQNRDKVREARRTWAKKNRDKRREAVRQWKKRNAEKVRERARRFYQSHKERLRGVKHRWRAQNRSKIREAGRLWYQEHKDAVQAAGRKGIEALSEVYVRKRLSHGTSIPCSAWPQELVELKRLQLQMLRHGKAAEKRDGQLTTEGETE